MSHICVQRGRYNEGDEMNKKNSMAEKMFFISRNEHVFWNVFYLPKLTGFFRKSAMRALDRKKHVLLMRSLNLMCTLIKNKRKKHNGLIL